MLFKRQRLLILHFVDMRNLDWFVYLKKIYPGLYTKQAFEVLP